MMLNAVLKRVLLVLLVLGLAACKKYTIETPVVDSLHTDEALPTFKVNYQKQPASLPVMQLNGFAVQGQFVAGAKSASADGADLQAYLKEGYNIFQVEPPLGPQVKFIYDTQGPEIMVLGAVVNDGGTITINGRAVDAMGVKKVTLNNDPVSVAQDGTFSVTVPKNDTYTYRTEDNIGHTNEIHYADLGMTYNPAVTVDINQKGLDSALWAVVNALNGADLNKLLGGTALYNSTWQGLFGETYGADGFVQDVSLAVNDLALDLQAGNQMALAGDINNLHVALVLRMHNGLLPPTIIHVGASLSLTMGATVNLGAQDGQPVVNIQNLTYNLGPIALDGLPPELNSLGSVITTGVANLVKGPVSEILKGVLNLAIPQLVSGLINEGVEIDIADHTGRHFKMAMGLGIEQLTTSEGALQAAVSGSLIPVTPDPVIPQPLAGTLFTFDELPPAQRNDNDLAISINTNLINQVLASAHAVGLTHMSMIGGGESDYFLQLGLPRDEDVGPADATHRILVNMGAPASLKVRSVEGRAEPTFKVYGLEIHGQSRKKGSTQFTNDIAVRVSAEVGLVLGLGTDNKLSVSFRQAPSITLEGVKAGEAPWTGEVVNAAANRLIATVVGKVLKELVRPIENIKLPTLACMSFDSIDVTAAGNEGGHLNLALSMSPAANQECINAVKPAPQVAYSRIGLPMSCEAGMENSGGLCYSACPEGYNGVGPVCWKKDASFGRGVGTIPDICADGKEKDAGLCYTPCEPGYNGVGPVCTSTLPVSYRRGAGTIPTNIWTGECPSGKQNEAGLCYTACNAGYNGVGPVCWLTRASYGRGVGQIPNQCESGKVNEGGLCYTPCGAGYHGVGSVCWSDQSLTVGRGVGAVPNTCNEGWEKIASLCYSPCKEGFNGVGSVCSPAN